MYAVIAKNIEKKFVIGNQKNIIFKNLSFFVKEGENIYINGAAGSGKTTLLKLIAALTPPNHGTIEVFGENLLTIENRAKWRMRHIGLITNEECLIPYLTAKQHLLMGLDETDHHHDIKYIFAMLELSDHKLLLYPEQLSFFDRLKMTIARTLMTNPRIILVDDISKNVKEDQRYELQKLIVEYSHNHNITLIIADESEQNYFSDRNLKLINGKLIERNEAPTIIH